MSLDIDEPHKVRRIERMHRTVATLEQSIRSGEPMTERMSKALEYRSRVLPREVITPQVRTLASRLLSIHPNWIPMKERTYPVIADTSEFLRKEIEGFLPEDSKSTIVETSLKQDCNRIRWLLSQDMPEVLEIDELSNEWESWGYDKIMEKRREKNCIGMVSEHVPTEEEIQVAAYHRSILRAGSHSSREQQENDWLEAQRTLKRKITGFMFYRYEDHGRVIDKIEVHPDHRHEGIGEQFIWKMIGQISSEQRKKLSMIVGESNLTGQLFGSSLGFRAEDLVPRYCEATGEDGILMEYVTTRNQAIKPDYFLYRIPFTPEVRCIPGIYAV